jgi:hypothetical protein
MPGKDMVSAALGRDRISVSLITWGDWLSVQMSAPREERRVRWRVQLTGTGLCVLCACQTAVRVHVSPILELGPLIAILRESNQIKASKSCPMRVIGYLAQRVRLFLPFTRASCLPCALL